MASPHKRLLVTAALPYANGYLHLGHMAGAYLPADLYVRYHRLKGKDVLFLCGSDEHGVAITVTGEQEGLTPQQVIDRYHPANEEAFRKFGMSFDHYSRTSIPLHHETTREFFRNFSDRSLLKEKREKQLFCEKDNMFLADRYVEGTCPKCGYDQARGDQCENCGSWLNQVELIKPKCKLCGTTPVVRETTHLYFPLGQFQRRLEKYVKERNKRDGWKENVLRYCESWFKAGLEDRAVTRDLKWGVPVPVSGFENKVIYVWFDAVLGYITAGKEWAARQGKKEAWKDYWQGTETKYVAFIGKDNVVFHCIVFPAMLMGWNDGEEEQYVLPENVPANEFLNFEGQKFSKSRGWGIDLRDFLDHFPADYLRYALAVTLPESRDSDFYLKDFQARVNNELADILGNFVNRTLAFTQRSFGGVVPPRRKIEALDREILEILSTAPSNVGNLFENYRLRDGVTEAMNLARAANKYFNDSEPWKTAKSDMDRCGTTIHIALQLVRSLAILFEPVTPQISRTIWKMLNLKEPIGPGFWDTAAKPGLDEGHTLNPPEILVSKIEDKQIDKILQSAGVERSLTPATTGIKPTISLEDFKKIDLRVAKVVEAEKIPKSSKLLRLKVEVGGEVRQIVAGIAQQYEPSWMVGKLLVVVANLQPVTLMGNESRGMLLAANADDGKLSIVTILDDLPPGTAVR
ncbi:MAG: methionine--tRNA ligase [Ignavibacteriales bacterium]|nr:methionine--tRNA ligase [Ignavibacteriales bacterium]